MKKYLFSWLLALIMVPAAASAYTYTVQPGDSLWKIAQQQGTSVQALVVQNKLLNPDLILVNQKLEIGGVGSGNLGAAIPTTVALYEDYLASRLTQTATSTFTLSRGTDKLSRSLSGYYGFVMDEGSVSTEEFFLANCSGTACTIVKRGIDIVDGSTQTSTLQHEHRRGASVKITNFPQLAIVSRILNGQDTLDNFPRITTSTNLPTSSAQLATKYYVDVVGAGGFTNLNVSSTRGLSVDGSAPERVGINASSTTGIAFGPDGAVYQKVSSTTGLASDSNGIKIVSSTLINFIATSTASANSIPISNASSSLDAWVTKRFGGDGSDGNFTATTTFFDLNNAKIFVKNFDNLTIEGNTSISFINAAATGTTILFRVKGTATLTSATTSINASNAGAAGAAGISGVSQAGAVGSFGYSQIYQSAPGGAGDASTGAGALGGKTSSTYFAQIHNTLNKYPASFVGAGGGSGGSGASSGCTVATGAGGRGGGAFILEVGGALNFTSSISANGQNGLAFSGTDRCGGGGGGSGGAILVLYNSNTTTITGTFSATGGTGSVGHNNTNGTGGGGAGNPMGAGTAGSLATGGNGAAGSAYIQKNLEY